MEKSSSSVSFLGNQFQSRFGWQDVTVHPDTFGVGMSNNRIKKTKKIMQGKLLMYAVDWL